MKIEQIYTTCLAEAAYYIQSGSEAVIIDPLREVAPYLEMAEANGAKIKYIFETHFHADFVSGHVDLAKATGATIVYGPGAETGFDAKIAEDGEEFQIGSIRLRTLHTPGHTQESTTWLLLDESGKEHAIFSGDTLFIGDVGRPDLAVKSDLSKEDLAGMLYNSLHQKIMPLGNEVIVYPAHGAGSACGKNMSSETYDTLGNQKLTNYALSPDLSREEFIKVVTSGLMEAPGYFGANVMLNKSGYENIDAVMQRGLTQVSLEAFQKKISDPSILVLDTRTKEAFAESHIPGSLFIGLDGSFAPWVGTLIADIEQKILLIVEPEQAEEAVTRLARVGYENVTGYLEGGFQAWQDAGMAVTNVKSVSASNLNDKDTGTVLDVRKPSEFQSHHVTGALNIPLQYISNRHDELSREDELFIHCKSGYRSLIAVSILMQNGFENAVNVIGGFEAILESETPVSAYVCPSTLTTA